MTHWRKPRVNHWVGISIFGWHIFWRAGKLNITRNYPHTEY